MGSIFAYGCSSVGRASVSKTECRAFESLLPCKKYPHMKIVEYFNETYSELVHKVSWPTWKDLQSSALIAMIASLLIAVVVFLMDISFENIMQFIYKLLY